MVNGDSQSYSGHVDHILQGFMVSITVRIIALFKAPLIQTQKAKFRRRGGKGWLLTHSTFYKKNLHESLPQLHNLPYCRAIWKFASSNGHQGHACSCKWTSNAFRQNGIGRSNHWKISRALLACKRDYSKRDRAYLLQCRKFCHLGHWTELSLLIVHMLAWQWISTSWFWL